MENVVNEPAVKYAITPEEYLEAERAANEKHEYYRGEIFAMSGASYRHNRIVSNIIVLTGTRLQGKSCNPLGSDMRVHIPSNSLFTYPDISIVCGDPEFVDGEMDNLLNPSVIIEVLSPSTRRYDRGIKFNLYRDIKSLKEYILVEQETMLIEKWKRQQDDSWVASEYNSPGQNLSIDSVDIALLLSDIYKGISFA